MPWASRVRAREPETKVPTNASRAAEVPSASTVVSTASTGQVGQEGKILRFVFWHSIALATIMAVIVMLQAYVFPWMIPEG